MSVKLKEPSRKRPLWMDFIFAFAGFIVICFLVIRLTSTGGSLKEQKITVVSVEGTASYISGDENGELTEGMQFGKDISVSTKDASSVVLAIDQTKTITLSENSEIEVNREKSLDASSGRGKVVQSYILNVKNGTANIDILQNVPGAYLEVAIPDFSFRVETCNLDINYSPERSVAYIDINQGSFEFKNGGGAVCTAKTGESLYVRDGKAGVSRKCTLALSTQNNEFADSCIFTDVTNNTEYTFVSQDSGLEGTVSRDGEVESIEDQRFLYWNYDICEQIYNVCNNAESFPVEVTVQTRWEETFVLHIVAKEKLDNTTYLYTFDPADTTEIFQAFNIYYLNQESLVMIHTHSVPEV